MVDPHEPIEFASIAHKYPRLREPNPENMAMWVRTIIAHGGLTGGDRLLDVGCGTGNFALPLAAAGLEVTGLDASPAMLAIARARDPDGAVTWLQGDATALPFADGLFDACFQSMMIMHVQNRRRLFQELRRVLQPGGACLVRMTSHEQIRRLDWYAAFPEMLEQTLARCPDTPEVTGYMESAGFASIDVVTVVERQQSSPLRRLEQVRQKAFSDLRALPEAEFRKGLAAYERYIYGLDEPERAQDGEFLLMVGRRPRGDG